MYRLVAAWSALAVLAWGGVGWFWPQASIWPVALRAIDWHANAMVAGFAGTVIVAFLLAPLRRWPTDRGWLAWSLLLCWLAARGLSMAPPALGRHAWLADLAFFGLAALALGSRAARAPTPNNLLFAATPWVLMLSLSAPMQGLELIAILIAVLAGRLIPGLVNARAPGRPAQIRVDLERIALGALVAAIALRALMPDSAVADLAAAFAALAHLYRWWRWAPVAGMRADLRVGMMLFAYAWLPVWLLVDAAGAWAPAGAGSHALAAGLVGGMIWAMMNRALAEPIGAPGHLEKLGAVALVVGVIARVALAFAPPFAWQPLAVLAVGGWVLAFAGLAVRGLGASPGDVGVSGGAGGKILRPGRRQ